jgi:hypothetical protein
LYRSTGQQLLRGVQQAVVAAQAQDHAGLRPDCAACGGGCHVKDWRLRQVATLFGGVTVRLPRTAVPPGGSSLQSGVHRLAV